jgi:hypothetical protein
MNNKIKMLVEQAEIVKGEHGFDQYALPDQFTEELTRLIITDVLDTVAHANINRCAYTTYDSGITECARIEIIKAINEAYGTSYNLQVAPDMMFPVRSNKHGKAY